MRINCVCVCVCAGQVQICSNMHYCFVPGKQQNKNRFEIQCATSLMAPGKKITVNLPVVKKCCKRGGQ